MILTKEGTFKKVDSFENQTNQQITEVSDKPVSKVEKWLVPIGCVTFFPLVYLIGKTITSFFN